MSPITPSLSPQGLDFIKRTQGLALAPYRDESGLREIAETLLTVDLVQCQRQLKRNLRVRLNPSQYEALVSLAFSCGPASPELDIVLTHLNHQRFAEALTAWENIRSGHEQRREECARFKATTD